MRCSKVFGSGGDDIEMVGPKGEMVGVVEVKMKGFA